MDLNFYQSDIWKNINKYILKKPVFEIEFLWKNYFWTIKEKDKLMLKLRWFQVTGIDLWPDRENNIELLQKEFEKIKKEFKTSYSDILFQFWLVNEIARYTMEELADKNFEKSIYEKRLSYETFMKKNFWLLPSFRENMPEATIYFDLWIGEEKLYNNISKSARAHIRKAQSRDLYFEFAQEPDREDFYNIWYQTAWDKGFNIISKNIFLLLKEYLLENKSWNLFLAKKDGKIISWSLCIFVDWNIVYLYWATNREFGNVWWHQFLKNEIFKRWFQNWYKYADLLWVAPAWAENHHLEWVTKFKQSLWWTKIEYLGNYDLVFDQKLYQTFKLFRATKHSLSNSISSIKTTILPPQTTINDKKIVEKDINKFQEINKEETKNLIQNTSQENAPNKQNEWSHLINEIENLKYKIEDINKNIDEKNKYLKDLETKYSSLENKINLHESKKVYFKIKDVSTKNLFDTKICIIWFWDTYKKFVENIIRDKFFETNWLDPQKVLYIDSWAKDWKETSIKTIVKYDIIIVWPNDHVIADMTLNSKNAIYDELIQVYNHKNVFMRTKNKKPYLTEATIREMVFEWLRNIV